jgi:hypothetical protein
VEKLTLKQLSEKVRRIINELPKHRSASRTFSQKRVKAFLTVTTLMLLSGFMMVGVMSAVQTSITVSTTGTISAMGVGVYWNSGYTNRTSTINWGTLDPGTQKSFTVYIRNEGNTAVTLTQSTSNWSPSTASNYLSLTWNYNGQTINPGSSIQITLTLTVNAGITGVTSFSFNIVIVGSN